ncbi:MAG: cell division protein CrgA [Streptosporangiaceae bacterium]|jgi:hypothetical protein
MHGPTRYAYAPKIPQTLARYPVPKSRVRKKPVYTPPPTKAAKRKVSAPWIAPTMVGCLLLGLVWIVLYYVTQADMPVLSTLGAWNLVGGFALIIASVVLATQWRLSGQLVSWCDLSTVAMTRIASMATPAAIWIAVRFFRGA